MNLFASFCPKHLDLSVSSTLVRFADRKATDAACSASDYLIDGLITPNSPEVRQAAILREVCNLLRKRKDADEQLTADERKFLLKNLQILRIERDRYKER